MNMNEFKALRFLVDVVPVAQPRHRASSIGGKARLYLPAKHPVHEFKKLVSDKAGRHYTGEPMTGPFCLRCLFVMPRPQRMIWKKREMPREEFLSKPDTDNMVKAVKDALTGFVWVDDSQVWREVAEKVYAAGGEMPHVEISIFRSGL